MQKNPIIRAGIYRHYKGALYKVIGIALHSENKEKLVVYRSVNDEHDLWVRPFDMFMGEVEVDGKKMARFTFVKN
jgi:hypothetical protein